MVAAMYDDLLGRSQLAAGFTGSITVRYRRPTPLNRDLDVRAWVDRVEGRKRWVHGTCHLDGELLTEAEGLFIAPRGGANLEGIVSHLGG
jgi:acyl-CoA thioesterase FadM